MDARVLLLVCGFLAFCSCSHNPTGPEEIRVLDFEVNSVAQYNWGITLEDSLGQRITAATDTFATKVASSDDVVGEYSGLIRMEASSVPHFIGTTRVWYKQYPDSLVEVAYSSAGATPVVLPKRIQSTTPFAGTANRSSEYLRIPLAVRWAMRTRGFEDSVIERSDKRIVYRYPLSVGTLWTSFVDPFLQIRQVEGYETVTVGNRTYWCAKILTRLPTLDPTIEWYDYVSLQGLVKRTVHLNGLLVTADDPDGTNGQTVSMTELLILMN